METYKYIASQYSKNKFWLHYEYYELSNSNNKINEKTGLGALSLLVKKCDYNRAIGDKLQFTDKISLMIHSLVLP